MNAPAHIEKTMRHANKSLISKLKNSLPFLKQKNEDQLTDINYFDCIAFASSVPDMEYIIDNILKSKKMNTGFELDDISKHSIPFLIYCLEKKEKAVDLKKQKKMYNAIKGIIPNFKLNKDYFLKENITNYSLALAAGMCFHEQFGEYQKKLGSQDGKWHSEIVDNLGKETLKTISKKLNFDSSNPHDIEKAYFTKHMLIELLQSESVDQISLFSHEPPQIILKEFFYHLNEYFQRVEKNIFGKKGHKLLYTSHIYNKLHNGVQTNKIVDKIWRIKYNLLLAKCHFKGLMKDNLFNSGVEIAHNELYGKESIYISDSDTTDLIHDVNKHIPINSVEQITNNETKKFYFNFESILIDIAEKNYCSAIKSLRSI